MPHERISTVDCCANFAPCGDAGVRIAARFQRAIDCNALDQLMQSIASMPHGRAIEVLPKTDLKRASHAFPLTFGSLEPTQGGVLLRATADDLNGFARRLAGLPFDFEIRKAAALRTELARCAKPPQALATG